MMSEGANVFTDEEGHRYAQAPRIGDRSTGDANLIAYGDED
jgi:hypothetical protein